MSVPHEIKRRIFKSLERDLDDALLDDEPPHRSTPVWLEAYYASVPDFDYDDSDQTPTTRVEAGDKPKPKRPSLKSVKQQAEKAGIEVARYDTRPDGTISIVPGKPEIAINEGMEITTPEQLRRLI